MGLDDLAALLVSDLKDNRVGSVYLRKPGVKDCGREYEYHVKCPTYLEVDAANAKDSETFQGLPIVVEAFRCTGGYSDKPWSLERIEIGGAEEDEEDGDG